MDKKIKVAVLCDNGFYYPDDVRHENGAVVDMPEADAKRAIAAKQVRKA